MQFFGCGLTRPCRGTLVLSGDMGIFPFLLVPLTDSVSPPPRASHVCFERCYPELSLLLRFDCELLRLFKFLLRSAWVVFSLAILWECLLLVLGDRLLACKLCRFLAVV